MMDEASSKAKGSMGTALSWQQRMKQEMLRDKKKAGILLVLLAVAAIVIAKAFSGGSTPSKAPAASHVGGSIANVATADHRSSGLAAEPGVAGHAFGLLPKASAKAKADADRREEYLQKADRMITRDLFKTNPDFFPLPGTQVDVELVQSTAQNTQDLADPGFLGMLTRQVRERQQVQREQLAKLSYVQGQAQALSLQSTIMGGAPTALINGQVLRVGQEIQGFTVKSISPNVCIVVKDGVEVEVPMKKQSEGK